MMPPNFIALERACSGRATLTVRGGKRTLLRRTLRIGRTCRFTTTVTSRRARKLTFTLRFPGNAALAAGTRRAVGRAG
jgi:hypothetical protein